MDQRCILTGGTGLIGTALQKSLRASGVTSIPLVRSREPASARRGVIKGLDAGASTVFWNPADPEAPIEDARALEGCEFAVHLAGANLASHRWTAAYKKKIIESRVDSSKALLAVFGRLKSPPRVLVCASATGIYGDRGNEVLTENSLPGEGFLPRVCTAWESAPEGARRLAIRVVHLRFGVVLAKQGGALASMLPVFRVGLGGRLGDGRQWMSWVTLEDVVRAIRFALETSFIQGAFNTVAPHPVINREFTRILGEVLRRPAPWIVPGFALKLLFGQMAQDTLLASTRAVPESLEAAGFHFHSPDLKPALQRILGEG